MSDRANEQSDSVLNVAAAVRERYSNAAQEAEAALCCPVDYDTQFLKVIPQEIIDRDYGCGDPSRYLEEGDVVLDLGSGGGKICYIAAQVVGASGRVIGVDVNDEMLALARKHRATVSETLGYSNVEFRKGQIQDLQLDLDAFEAWLCENPVRSSGDWMRAEEHARTMRDKNPLIPDSSVTAVVSNCVLNLVDRTAREQLFAEVFRVLQRGGRAVISDIVSDEDVPEDLQRDPRLWSGCMSGAFREDRFLAAFEDAGFHGVELVAREETPWAVVDGIEFRSVTVRAWKGKQGPCLDRHQAVIYRGPWKAVVDDDGHRLLRGQRMAVCDKTFRLYTQAPYADDVIAVEPAAEVPLSEAKDFDCRQGAVRTPAVTKKGRGQLTQLPAEDCCGPESCC